MLTASVTAAAASGARVELLAGDKVIASAPVEHAGHIRLPVDRGTGRLLLRAIVRRSDGRTILISNAVIIDD